MVAFLRAWGTRAPAVFFRKRRLITGFLCANIRRRCSRKHGRMVPVGLGVSVAMRCNLSCLGCYARFHSAHGEVKIEDLDKFIRDAASAGVFLFVITGGEPFIREEMMSIYAKYPRVLFLIVTNGTLIDEGTADTIARLGNIFPVLSLEGSEDQTDRRRGKGTYRKVLKAMELLLHRRVLFGFSAVITRENCKTLVSSDFIRTMRQCGCIAGFYNTFIPLEPAEKILVPTDEEFMEFRGLMKYFASAENMLLLHLPDDEYNEDGLCTAVAGGSMHVNAQGFVEPCPFARYARENIKTHTFNDILDSPFLSSLRRHPSALKKKDYGCSLSSNTEILCDIASRTGASSTDTGNARCKAYVKSGVDN